MAESTVTLDIVGRDKASPAFKSTASSAGKAAKTIEHARRGMLNLGKAAALGLAGGVAVGAAAMVGFVRDAEESRRVGKLTAAVLKSTGGEAKVTAKHVSDLATAISNKTGIDDEAIQSGENLLLTFTGIRNEVGKGNQIFDRATHTITDMSAALGQDTKTSAIQLGKALNDPIKGVTALQRVGVSFTQKQKDQIKGLVEHGKVLKAQKIILHELGIEFGGAAAAASSPMQRLRTILDNLGESVGTALLPYVDKAAGAIGRFATEMQNGTGPGGRFADKVQAVWDKAKQVGTVIRDQVIPALKDFVGYITNTLVPALRDLSERVTPALQSALGSIAGSVKIIGGAFRTSGGNASGFARDMDKVNVAAKTVDGLLLILKTNVRLLAVGFRVATAGPKFFAEQITKAIFAMLPTILNVFGAIVHAAAKAFGWIPGLGGKLNRAAGAFDAFRARVEGAISGIGAKGYNLGRDFANGLAAGISAGGAVAVAAAQGVANRVAAGYAAKQQSSSPSKVAIKLGGYFSEGIAVGIRKGGKKAVDAVGELVDNAVEKVKSTRDKLASIRDSVGGAIRGVFDVGAIGAQVGTGQFDADGNEIMRTPSARETISGFATQAGAFATALAQMAAKKFAPSVIAAVAAAGPASGLTAAQALASSSAADVTAINSSMRTIDQAASGAANTVVSTTRLPAELKREEATLATLRNIEAQLKADKVAEIRVRNGDELYVVFKRAEQQRARRG